MNSANDQHEKLIKDRKRFAGEKIPSMKRRSEDHDYHSKRFYMITLVVKERYALLGRLVGHADATLGSEDAPRIVLSPLGQQVYDEWMGISKHYKEVAVIACQMMPDHLHGILYVREETDYHLGQVIKGFKLGCNRILRAALETQRTREGKGLHEQTDEDAAFAQLLLSYTANTSQSIGRESLWEAKYNDKILHNYSSLQKWKDYLADNPRRLTPTCSGCGLGIKRPEESMRLLPLVFLTPWGFNSFSKPGHQYYEACADGRFLILAPWEHQNERVNLTRAMCLELNEMAQELADS